MTRPCPTGLSPLTATALVGLAVAGAVLGLLPELAALPDPRGAAPLALVLAALALAVRSRQGRERRIAARLRGLRLAVRLPPPATLREEELTFHPAGRAVWRAARNGWHLTLRRAESEQPCWHLGLTRQDSPDPALPLAMAASLDALLRLARALLPGTAQPGLRDLLDCDLAFSLPQATDGECGITALAEGGYALRGPAGCHAIAPAQAEALLLRGSAVVAF